MNSGAHRVRGTLPGTDYRLNLAVGIATADRRDVLAAMLHDLSRQTRLPDRLVICPAQETDVDPDALARFPAPTEIVAGPRGLCAQRNAILSHLTKAEVVVFFDDDFLPHRQFLEEIEQLFLAEPDIVMATGKVLADGVTGPGLALERGQDRLRRAEVPRHATLRQVHNAYGCNMAIRLEPVRHYRLFFDEALPFYSWLEDVDFSRRLAVFGRVVKSDRLVGVHLGTKRGRTSGLRFGYSQIANPIYLVRKGSLAGWRAGRQMARNVAANLGRLLLPEPWVDRKGRLRGNILAFRDLMRGALAPERILEFKPVRTAPVPGAWQPRLMEKAPSQSPGRVLVISAIFPPDIIGGAEVSAANLAHWLKRRGFEVGVLTTAKSPAEVCADVEIDGLRFWQIWTPRAYPLHGYGQAKLRQKPLWHLQDHVDPRNRIAVANVLDAFKPDWVNVHVLQGIGYNALSALAERKVPTVYFLHDLSLACFRMAMFRQDMECRTQCTLCKISSAYKLSQIEKLPYLGFCSPSSNHLETLAGYFPLKRWPHTAILNANRYPAATAQRAESGHLRLLYVGRIHSSKGVPMLLEVCTRLARSRKFSLEIIGTGPDAAPLQKKYGREPWCTFLGFRPQKDISNHMINSDILCVPSIWSEPAAGGAIVHALQLGLPVLGSAKGGIPELVEDGRNGLLLPAGDADAWEEALKDLIENPAPLEIWRRYALAHAERFDQDRLGERILEFINQVRT